MVHSYFSPDHHKMIIYQLMVRMFGNTNGRNKPYGTIKENGAGKFNDISEKALNGLKELGVSHIWFTGILEHSGCTGYPEHNIPADDPYIVKGRAGSPYAVRDYYDVDADLAVDVKNRLGEFDAMIKRTHANGIKAIIDFVPNHVARSYSSDKNPGNVSDFGKEDNKDILFAPENNFLYLQNETFQTPKDYIPLGGKALPKKKRYAEFPAKVTGNDVYSATPSLNDWFETVKLNFGVDPFPLHVCHFDPIPSTWQKLLDILLYWCKRGIDGFRCDMAEMVPPEFWEWIIPCVKAHYPDVIFIAEIYKPEIYDSYLDKGNFDYLYDKVRLYDTLVGILRGQTNADELTQCARSIEQFSERMLSFLENHDEERLTFKNLAGNAAYTIAAMVVCATISKGPVMIYNGQEVGEPGDGNIGFAGERGRSSIFDYGNMPELNKWVNKNKYDGALLSAEQKDLRNFYSKLLKSAMSNEAIHSGDFYDLQYINRFNQSEGFDERFVYAFIRHTAKQRLLIIVNFNKKEDYNVSVKIPPEAFTAMGISMKKNFIFEDILYGDYKKEFKGEEISKVQDRMSGVQLKLEANKAYILKFD